MHKHDNTDYWDCSCRKYDPNHPERKSVPDDDCEPLHYNYVTLRQDVERIIKYSLSILDEPDAAAYMIDQLEGALKRSGY